MKKLTLFLLLSLLVVVLLSGCGSAPKREVVKEIDVKVITIPDNLLRKCKATPPLVPDTYITLKAEEKETALVDLNIKLYTDIKNCNDQVTEIGNFQQRQLEIIKKSQNEK